MSISSSSSSEVFQGNWKIIECINISKSKNSPPARIEGAVFILQDNGEIRWDLTCSNNNVESSGGGGGGGGSTGRDDMNEIDRTFPLFQCDCYEIVHSFVGISIQMGAISGHMFEFWIDRPVPRDTMLLTFEGWIVLQCQQVKNNYVPTDSPFSLLPAFTEGFFSDLALNTNCLSKEFKIHSVIMNVSNGNVEELSSLPSDVLETTLHFLYSRSLPATLTKETVTRCIQFAPPTMTEFIQMSRQYLHRILLKQKILKLVNEVHSCAEAMSSSFHEDTVQNPTRFCSAIKIILRHGAVAFIKLVELCVLYGEEASQLERNERLEILRYAKTRLPIFLTQFVALLRNVKNDFACVKTSERNDIATCITPEIENLLDLLSTLMREMKDACSDICVRWSKECTSIGNCDNGNIGNYTGCFNPNTNYAYGFWQDCQPLLETFPTTGGTTTTSSGTGTSTTSSSSPSSTESGSGSSSDTLIDSLFGIFRKREIMKLHSVQGQVAAIYLYLAQKRENFEEMTTAVKVRCVARNLEQLLEELPIFLLRLEEIMMAFDDRFQWKDFKFCLQLAISQVYQTVQHLMKEGERLQKFFNCLVDLVQRDEFYQSLVNLKLLITTSTTTSTKAEAETTAEEASCEHANPNNVDDATTHNNQNLSIKDEEFALLNSSIPESKLCAASTIDDKEASFGHLFGCCNNSNECNRTDELNLLEDLCTPKKSKENILAGNSAKLYNSDEFSDMVFEIPQDDDKDGSGLEIPSHRVIVAARCDWFRRALLSGMRESIQKRIVIHDCSPQIFQLFLNYVYTGRLDDEVNVGIGTDSSSTCNSNNNSRLLLDTLSDLIALADRYELDSLKATCEQEMMHKHLDENSVIFLLSMADQYNARSLRGSCMEYIASNPDIMAKELFEQLSPELQMEVYDITMWSKPKICLI